jgi:hypothetical protein
MPRCNARRINGGGLRCRAWALKGKTRCKRHGGATTPHKTPESHARSIAAKEAGFQRYVQRMRDAKAMGIITEMPWQGWNRPKGLHTLAQRNMKEAAMAIIEKEIATLPVVEKPLEQQTMGELLATNARKGLLKAHHILSIECEDDNYKLMSIQKDLIATTLTAQVRVDESVMRRQSADRLPELLKRIQAIKAESLVIEAEPSLVQDEDYPL